MPPDDNRRRGCYTVGLGPVAQLVEQRIENPRVDGSIPSQATIHTDPHQCELVGVLFLKWFGWCLLQFELVVLAPEAY